MAQWNFRGITGSNYAKINSTTSQQEIVPAYDECIVNINGLVIANTSGTVTRVIVSNGVSNIVFQVPANNTISVTNILLENTINTSWTAKCGTSVDSIEITSFFIRN